MNTFSTVQSVKPRFDFARALVVRTMGALHEWKRINRGTAVAGAANAGMHQTTTKGDRSGRSHWLPVSNATPN